MDKKTCPDGQSFDILVRACVNIITQTAEPGPHTDPALLVLSPVRGSGLRTDSAALGLSPVLVAIAVLLTVGSVLALAVWFTIYRRWTRPGSGPEDPEPAQEPLQKREPPATVVPPLPHTYGHAAPSCPHLYLGAHEGSTWEVGVASCRGPAVQANGCTGLSVCSAVSEHKLPLPATELGGTALVTTKTV